MFKNVAIDNYNTENFTEAIFQVIQDPQFDENGKLFISVWSYDELTTIFINVYSTFPSLIIKSFFTFFWLFWYIISPPCAFIQIQHTWERKESFIKCMFYLHIVHTYVKLVKRCSMINIAVVKREKLIQSSRERDRVRLTLLFRGKY